MCRVIFFFKQKTAYEMRISDWSSDVCSSDLLTRAIRLNIPLMWASMETVTEAKLAIALEQEGGLGIVHKNMTAERQAAEVRAGKKHEAGVITDPITVPPTMTIVEVIKRTRANRISGVPVVDGKKLVGIVTSRDVRFETRFSEPVSRVMTPKDRLVTVREGARSEEHTSELQSLMRISYAVFCLKKKNKDQHEQLT